MKDKVKFLRKAAESDLINFCMATDRKYEVNWHHDLIAKTLMKALERVNKGEKSRIILQLPPRHGKSELATIKFPAWALGKFPE